MMTIVEFKPEHLDQIELKDNFAQGDCPKTVVHTAFTVLDGATVVAILGGFPFVPGVIHWWTFLSKHVEAKPLEFHKLVLGVLRWYEDHENPRRMQFEVKASYPEGQRWAESLGFVRESLLKSWGPNGEDCYLYVRVKGQRALEKRAKIELLQDTMLAMPQVELPLEHHFSDGLYLRQMTMPKGSVVVGKIHKTEHHCILSKGHVTVATEAGRFDYKAPAIIHALPGTKRVLYAHEDSVWVNCHHNPDNLRDLDAVDEHFVADTYEQFLTYSERKELGVAWPLQSQG